MYDLSGKVAVVTGGGRPNGIGAGMARRLAREGAHVVVVDICREYEPHPADNAPPVRRGCWEELLERQKEIEAIGVRSLAVRCDCTDEQDVDAMVAAVVKEFGHIDILMNVAGGSPPGSAGPLLDVDATGWDNGMMINFKTAHLCCRAAAKQMIAQGTGGKIVNTASQAGLKPFASVLGMYCPAKAALVMYTKVLALELAPYKITVNAVCPGTVTTDMLMEGLTEKGKEFGMSGQQIIDQFVLSTIPLGRTQTADDVADCAVWLASSQADYITGVAILTTGGQTIV
jgi:NAD(P)-dependent dehydrogenase (short-subunit alcohol dehydrogenase family)